MSLTCIPHWPKRRQNRQENDVLMLHHGQHRVISKMFDGTTADIERNNTSKGFQYTLLERL
jgi:hypothetical protein